MKRLFLILLASVLALTVSAQSIDEQTGMLFFKNQQYKEAVPYLQRAAKAGSGRAQAALGQMYLNGWGVSKNYQISMNMFKHAAESQESAGLFGIGLLYEKGYGVEKDVAKAFSYYKRAADMGSPLAKYCTGHAYMNGEGTEKNVEQGLKYLERSETFYAYEYLGWLYYEGKDVPQNYEKAMHWFQQGNIEYYPERIRFHIALMYLEGRGTPVNYAKSLELLDRLRKEEYPGAADAYQQVLQLQKESQKSKTAPKDPRTTSQKPKTVLQKPETEPSFPGGFSNMMSFIASHLEYPRKAQKKGVQGKVVLVFMVKKDGSLDNIRVKQGISPELDKEAIRVVLSMPKWNPATAKGKPVDAEVTLPINFKLS